VMEPFSLRVIVEPFFLPLRVPHPLAIGLGAGDAAIPKPPEIVEWLLLFNLSHNAACKLSDSVFVVLFLPWPTVVVRSATPNPGWQVAPETALVAMPLSTVMRTTPTPFPAKLPRTFAAFIMKHEQFAGPLGQMAE
jgi:hypothetical protein